MCVGPGRGPAALWCVTRVDPCSHALIPRRYPDSVREFVRTRTDTALGLLAFLEQLGVLKRKRSRSLLGCVGSVVLGPAATTLAPLGRSSSFVNPDTVVGRHRVGFRLYWHWRSRRRGGRPRIREKFAPWSGAWHKKIRAGVLQNPRRTPEARLRGLRKERGRIFTAYSAPGRSGQKVACVS